MNSHCLKQVIYEDLPSNLCAIRDYIEKRGALDSGTSNDECCCREDEDDKIISSDVDHQDAAFSTESEKIVDSSSERPPSQRPRVPGLQRDMNVLKDELLKFISEHGQEGFMPMRKQLRLHGRVDIEKAITRMGGFRRIASLFDLSLAYKHRKPKGYWDNFENLEEEVFLFF